MSKKRFKQYLMLLTVVGLVAIAAGGSGTFASFSAEVTNPGNTFASGTLFLHDTANGGTACTSESNSLNVNPGTGLGGTGNACDLLFSNVSLTGGDATATIALNNSGTVSASDLKWDVSSCSVATNIGATGSSVTFGSAPACSDLWLTIQETGSSFLPAGNVACAAGTTTTPPACDAPDGTYSLASSTPTNLLTTTAAAATFSGSQTRYYVIKIHPNVTNDNSLQNRKITFAMHWKLEQ
jgi:predicted ribosomally synthesized peptide with SipW-like signal peptide